MSASLSSSMTPTPTTPAQPRPSVSSRVRLASCALLLCGLLGPAGCGSEADEGADAAAKSGQFTFEIVATYPHDETAFTQGLVFHDGRLYETTGQYGQSRLRKVDLETGKSLQEHRLPMTYFGEGMAIVPERREIYQITYKEQTGFVYDLNTFEEKRRFPYLGEGWGLAYDGREIVMSNGTSTLTFLEVPSGKPVRRVEVKRNGKPVIDLNELEYVDGVLFANIWKKDIIARIDPQSGEVLGYVDLRDLRRRGGPLGANAEVLNGVAWDAEKKRLFVTGKYWSKLFEIRLVPKE